MPAALTVRNLAVRYRNGALGVADVSLEARAGQVVALFGANGAGKTTCVRAITGFLRTEGARVIKGTIDLFGKDCTNMEPHRISGRGVAGTPERRKIFANLTVMENLSAVGVLPQRADRQRLHDEIFSLFPVLWERRREQAGRLSGGQQQMLAIGRSLICQPRLMVIDEMTLGLHHAVQPPLFEAVQKVAVQGTAVLLVDESAGLALEVADYCYVLASGRVYDAGPPERFRGNELLAAGYLEAAQ